MKKVFICSPYKNEDYLKQVLNLDLAKEYCKFACLNGVAPFAPHIFYTQFLNDVVDFERDLGIDCGIEYLNVCDELWVFANLNSDITPGMKSEITYFSTNHPDKPIKYFTFNMIKRTYEEGNIESEK